MIHEYKDYITFGLYLLNKKFDDVAQVTIKVTTSKDRKSMEGFITLKQDKKKKHKKQIPIIVDLENASIVL